MRSGSLTVTVTSTTSSPGRAVVTALEQQSDSFLEGQQSPNRWAAETSDIPSADQLGAEFENFQRTVSDDDAD